MNEKEEESGDRGIKKPVSGFVSPTGQRFYIQEEEVSK